MIDFVIGLLQGLAFVFVLYGAYLATSWAGVRLGDGPLASPESEKKRLLEGSVEPRVERRQRTRRRADRRRTVPQDLYGVPM